MTSLITYVNDNEGRLGPTRTEEDELVRLESDVRSFEQCLIQALMDPLDQQSLAAVYLSSMKLLPYINNPTTCETRGPRAAHRKYLIDRVFLLLLTLHHPDCTLGKSKQKFKPSSSSASSKSTRPASEGPLPRDWLLGILAQAARQK
ncbi:hypothetical protein PTTG_29627 [Puccinia triticina 1-1 BBBD Race 1]|uniref:Uncharacterized protein n=1 Tax=Puccinia triticina (isolate 1-1 / race 1 (BBBD)) TaxID=630390 RepID=A0A180G554_PUCT1|nr:hypothetical protein PTTG_29627 [Puccinia triticina 1-1 BBBD Race 1]